MNYTKDRWNEVTGRKLIVVGIDQSYKDTGISISYNNKLKSATHCFTQNLKNNTEKREALKQKLISVFDKTKTMQNKKDCEVIVIIERIRLQSQGFINIDYIKSIGALNAMIVDIAYKYDFPVYSADTRAWKSKVIGTSKGQPNAFGIDEKKLPTILWCVNKGFEKYIIDYNVGKLQKGVIYKDGVRVKYNDNIADSICIGLYGFKPHIRLKQEH